MSQITLNALVGYFYGNIGNVLKNAVNGQVTIFTFDDANQLVSSTTDGVTTRYEYDAAGRLVREGDKRYTYGYLDKVTSVKEGANVYTYDYHVDGQLAKANYGKDGSEDFTWDGLALIQRGNEHFINEPHVGGGNPVVSSKGTSYFNDMLGTTVGAKSGKQYSAATLTAFGEAIENGSVRSTPTPSTYTLFYTGKPQVVGLGHAFLMRNYRSTLGKWQTADPMGYPDGWNQLAYCNNGVTGAVDLWGCVLKEVTLTIKTDWDYQSAAQSGGLGYVLSNVYKYMKDKWETGSEVMNLLKIKTVEDLAKKLNEKLSDDVKAKLSEILKSDNWLDELLIAEGGSGYHHEMPTESQILAEFTKVTGKSSYEERDDPVLVGVKVDYEQVWYGSYVIWSVDQVWNVKVKYE